MTQPQVGTVIPKSLNDRAKQYQAYVYLKSGRRITVAEALTEIAEIGAAIAMPDTPHTEPAKKNKK